MQFTERKGEHRPAGACLCCGAAALLPLIECFGAQLAASLRQGFHGQRPFPNIGIILYSFNIALGHKLQPHRLPDPGGAGIVTAVRVIKTALLSPRLSAASRIVPGIDAEVVFPLFYQLRNVHTKGGIAAFVPAGLNAVHPHPALIVHCAEMQKNPAV